MVFTLLQFALFLLVVFLILPIVVYTVYVWAFTRHFRERGFWHEHETKSPSHP